MADFKLFLHLIDANFLNKFNVVAISKEEI
jgi:hypothetical protein